MEKRKKLSWLNYLAYGAGDLYGGGSFFIVTTFSMYYLVNVIGLHPVLAGLIPAIGKLWDAISDPMMGYIADITPDNKFGKRRVWFLISIIPIALSFIMIWWPIKSENQWGSFIFYTIAYIFFFTVTTFSYVPYAALSAEMTNDTKERNLLNSTRILFSFIATLVAGLVAQPIIDAFNGSAQGYLVMGVIFGVFFALPWIPLYFGTWELPYKNNDDSNKNFIKNFLTLFKNKSCRYHIAMYIGSFGTLDIFMSLILFYLVDYLQRGAYFVVAQGSLLIFMIIMLPYYNHVANKKGHAVAYKRGLIIFAVSLVLLGLHTPNTPVILLILNVILMGSGISAGSLIPHQLLPFVTDVDKLVSGRDRAGTYSAAMTLARKIFLGLVIMTSLGALLSGIGYKNPVPSVLTENQFKEILTLSEEGVDQGLINNNERKTLIDSYLKLSDNNYHLLYFPNIQKDKLFDQKSLSESEYNEKLNSFDPHTIDGSENRYIFSLSYSKNNSSYNYNSLDYNVIKESQLYNLKNLLDTIDYKFSGIGEVRKPIQKDSTLSYLRIFFVILPLIVCITGIYCATRFPLTPKNHQIILNELLRLENGGKKADASDEVKRVCKIVSGIDYEKINWS